MAHPLKMISDGCRSCGECQECCTAIGVEELEKAAGERCRHQCGSGCAIYEERPASCQRYACAWLMGFIDGDERRRPDHLGLIFDLREEQGVGYMAAWETRPGAANEASYLLGKLRQRIRLVVGRIVDQEGG